MAGGDADLHDVVAFIAGLTRASDGKLPGARAASENERLPQGNATSGRLVWVLKGAQGEEYKGVAQFSSTSPPRQPGVVAGVTATCDLEHRVKAMEPRGTSRKALSSGGYHPLTAAKTTPKAGHRPGIRAIRDHRRTDGEHLKREESKQAWMTRAKSNTSQGLRRTVQ